MSKKIFSILSVILIIVLFLFTLSPDVYAGSATAGFPTAEELHQQAENFTQQGAANAKIDVNKIAAILKPLAGLLLGIGTVVLVVVTAVMGIKYMAATPETRGKLKTQLIGIAVSAIVLYGAYGIWSLVYTIMTDLTS